MADFLRDADNLLLLEEGLLSEFRNKLREKPEIDKEELVKLAEECIGDIAFLPPLIFAKSLEHQLKEVRERNFENKEVQQIIRKAKELQDWLYQKFPPEEFRKLHEIINQEVAKVSPRSIKVDVKRTVEIPFSSENLLVKIDATVIVREGQDEKTSCGLSLTWVEMLYLSRIFCKIVYDYFISLKNRLSKEALDSDLRMILSLLDEKADLVDEFRKMVKTYMEGA